MKFQNLTIKGINDGVTNICFAPNPAAPLGIELETGSEVLVRADLMRYAAKLLRHRGKAKEIGILCRKPGQVTFKGSDGLMYNVTSKNGAWLVERWMPGDLATTELLDADPIVDEQLTDVLRYIETAARC